MAEKLNVKMKLVKLFDVKTLNNEKQTKYRNCHVQYTDKNGNVQTKWARIWETSLENGVQIGDELNAELDSWTTPEGKVLASITVFGGSDATAATLDEFADLIAVKPASSDLNTPL
jgi:hypothetical protein